MKHLKTFENFNDVQNWGIGEEIVWITNYDDVLKRGCTFKIIGNDDGILTLQNNDGEVAEIEITPEIIKMFKKSFVQNIEADPDYL